MEESNQSQYHSIKPTAPFQYFVLDVCNTGIDGKTFRPAYLILFYDLYTNIVFHNQYTSAKFNKTTIVQFLRYIANKYNFGRLNISYDIITSLDQEYKPIINMFLPDSKNIIFDQKLADYYSKPLRPNYVQMG